MAVQKVPQVSTIAIKLQKGVTTSGNPAYVTRSYPCKVTVADQDIYDVALGIVGLQTYPVSDIERVDNAILLNA